MSTHGEHQAEDLMGRNLDRYRDELNNLAYYCDYGDADRHSGTIKTVTGTGCGMLQE